MRGAMIRSPDGVRKLYSHEVLPAQTGVLGVTSDRASPLVLLIPWDAAAGCRHQLGRLPLQVLSLLRPLQLPPSPLHTSAACAGAEWSAVAL